MCNIHVWKVKPCFHRHSFRWRDSPSWHGWQFKSTLEQRCWIWLCIKWKQVMLTLKIQKDCLNRRLDTKNSRVCHIHGDLLVKICLPFTYGSVYPKCWLHLWYHPQKHWCVTSPAVFFTNTNEDVWILNMLFVIASDHNHMSVNICSPS